MFAEQRTKK